MKKPKRNVKPRTSGNRPVRPSSVKPSARPVRPSSVKPSARPVRPSSVKPEEPMPSARELRGIFRKLGLYGWDEIEIPLLAALTAGIPIMLVGTHGASKTEAVSKITNLVYGEDSSFRAYEAPNVQMDDLIGYPNPKDLTNGILSFIPTQTSIWDVDVALFDELNRANPFTQSKLHELIRARRISGLSTKLKAVFSSVNPARKYNVTLLDMALATRFMHFTVPSLVNMSKHDIDQIVNLADSRDFHEDRDYSEQFGRARRVFRKIGTPPVALIIVKEILANVPTFSGRQAVMFASAVKALHSFEKVFKYTVKVEDVVTLALASVPECHNIVNDTVDKNELATKIKSVLMSLDSEKIADQLVRTGYSTETGLILDDLVNQPEVLSRIYDVLVKSSRSEDSAKILNAVKARLRLNDVLEKTVEEVFEGHVYLVTSMARGKGRVTVDQGIIIGDCMVTLDGRVIDMSGCDPYDGYNYRIEIAKRLDIDGSKFDLITTPVGTYSLKNMPVIRGMVTDIVFSDEFKSYRK